LLLAGLVAAGAACSPRLLVVVDPCGDAATASCPTGSPNPLLRDVVGWWRLDDGTGMATASDSSGLRNDGMLVELVATQDWVPGRAGSALDLRGAGYVLVPHSPSIDSITDQITISAWVYFEGSVAVDYGTALSREIGTTVDQHYHISLFSDDAPTLFITTAVSGGTGYVTDRLHETTPVPRFVWTHLAGTYDGATARLYVNGVSVQSMPASGPIAPDTTPLVLGGNGNGSPGITERFPGRIDELMLYRRALSPSEIRQLADGALF
jgi:hypothetical protein